MALPEALRWEMDPEMSCSKPQNRRPGTGAALPFSLGLGTVAPRNLVKVQSRKNALLTGGAPCAHSSFNAGW